jgi:acyl transferase domain-containing protein
MKAYVFPGQGAQYSGIGLDLYEKSSLAREMFNTANTLLGFPITEIMFTGSDEELKQTKFRHSCRCAWRKVQTGNDCRSFTWGILRPGGQQGSVVRERTAACIKKSHGHAESL